MNQSEIAGARRFQPLAVVPTSAPESLRFRKFQKEDLARGALTDGLIASLDTGLGKSIYGYTYALLKCGWTLVKDTLGKQWLQPNRPVLLIVPGDLHAQMIAEGEQKLHVQTRVIASQAEFAALIRGADGRPRLTEDGRPIVPPGFYITSYTQLTTNNVARQQDPDDHDKPRELLKQWALKEFAGPLDHAADPQAEVPAAFASVNHLFLWRRKLWRDEYDLLQVSPEGSLPDLDAALEFQTTKRVEHWRDPDMKAKHIADCERAHKLLAQLYTLKPQPKYGELTRAQQDFVLREFLRRRFTDYALNEGETMNYPIGAPPTGYITGKPETDTRAKWRVKCVYDPSLADLSYRAFDCVVIDEGVKMKGTDTYVGLGVRSMEAMFRCVLTATPIKNRLPDIFWLAWWAAGGREEAHARFPYRNDSSEREEFARTFLVSERNLTKEEAARANGKPYRGRFTKLTARICNVHRLWKLICPLTVRRRKDECGEDLVPRLRKMIRVEMGSLQKAVYRYHLEADYRDINDQKAVGAQLQSLRIAAADPTASLLPDKGEIFVSEPCGCPNKKKCPHCHGTGQKKVKLPHRSGNPYTPKFAAVLSLIQEIIARNEQVLVGTVFNESHDHLGALLREANVPFYLADGRTPPAQRGPLMQRFRGGAVPVCLGGLESIANGHNLDTVNNVIIYAYSWAYDLIKQFLDRVWRLTSRKPVNVYVVLCNGTIDRKLEALNWEKTDSVELALDGRLIGEHSEEISLAELLNIAHEEFDTKDQSVDEAAIQREWPQLKASLATAMQTWSPDIPAELRVKPAPLNPNRNLNPILSQRGNLPTSNLKLETSNSDYRQKMKALAAALRALPARVPAPDVWDNL